MDIEKPTARVQNIEKDITNSEDKLYPLCKKTFSCGKALEGHKRNHFRRAKRKSAADDNPQNIMELRISDPKLESLNCHVGDKSFVSDKALYGNMRKHTYKNWRGAEPPSVAPENGRSLVIAGSGFKVLKERKQPNADQNSGFESSGPDLLPSGWSRRGRRRRHGKAEIHLPASDDDRKEKSMPGYEDRELIVEPTERERLPPKKRLASSRSSSNGLKKHKDQERKPLIGYDVVEIGTTSSAGPKKLQYGCSMCRRLFNSYQALGGHKAHHVLKDCEESSATANGTVVEFVERVRGHRTRNLIHQCPFCDKVFAKGQALGGHKRHCRGPVPDPLARQEAQNESMVFEFDLNELPPT